MNRPQTARAPTRTLAQFNASQGLELVIAETLAAGTIDDSVLQRVVWTYVGEERRAGTAVGRVILTLTELIEQSLAVPRAEQNALARRVILWCVEAYYDDVGGPIPDDVAIGAHGRSPRSATVSGRVAES